jgi:hypothetical protein
MTTMSHFAKLMSHQSHQEGRQRRIAYTTETERQGSLPLYLPHVHNVYINAKGALDNHFNPKRNAEILDTHSAKRSRIKTKRYISRSTPITSQVLRIREH